MDTGFPQRIARRIPLVLGFIPLALLIGKALTVGLGANPIAVIIRSTGSWALALLVLTLGLAPLGRILRWEGAIHWRRMCGLFAFFYACLHTAAYVGLDQFFSITDIARDVARRPHVTVGLLSFVLLTPPAATSFGRIAERLGERRWQRIHQLVYPAAALGVVHYVLAVKVNTGAPFIYAVVLTALLLARLWYLLPRRDRRTPQPPHPSSH